MSTRPLHALLLPPTGTAGWVSDALGAALDGTGPAIAPLDAQAPPARLAALIEMLAPDAVGTPDGTRNLPAGTGVRPEVAVVITTSGSTGEPKGVQLSAAALLHSAQASLDRIGARPGERWLCPLPLSHIAGLGVLVRSLVAGTTPVVIRRVEDVATGLDSLGCAHASFVPTQLRRLLAARADLAALRTVLLGGAAVPAGLLASARSAGARVVTTYGMSETCGGCVYDGMPLDGVRVRSGPGDRIEIEGPVLFSGYRGRPDLTGQVMTSGRFLTSDLGVLDEHGRLTVTGRADEMIITGGEKVAPGQVAATLEDCPGVAEAVVIGEPDPEWGERVTAVVVPEDPRHPPRLDDLRTHTRAGLPAYAAPRALLVVGEVPLLASGKPDLVALHRLARAATTHTATPAPRDDGALPGHEHRSMKD